MTIAIFIALALLLSYFIAKPVLSARTRGVYTQETNHKLSDLAERKESVYSAIKEIEFDYQMGKLSEEDFQELRQQYKNEAVQLLRRIGQVSGGGKTKGAKQKVSNAQKVNFCWSCGEPLTGSEKFCSGCGESLKA